MSSLPAATAIETHLSQLFFTPDRVFKMLKPVNLAFVDFSDRDKRCAAAAEEFERNRQFSPDVYLGLADIVEHGEIVDRMIVMRRLPAEQELARLARGPGGISESHLRAVARYLAGIHSSIPALRAEAADAATLDSVSKNWEDNFAEIHRHVGSLIDPDEFHRTAALARSFMAGRAPLFQKRIDDGWVREGHGDLRAEHIYCTDDGPRLIDCVAFDKRLQVSDVLADIAFLAMDLDRLAGPQAAIALMAAWNEFTNEHHPASLAHFYVAYRAHVRCKIACIRFAAGDASARDIARSYHAMALRHLELARIRLVLVGGGPGTGKSTIAEGVSKYLGAAWLRSDEVRKDVAGVCHDSHSFAAPYQGIYTPEISASTQEELIRQTRLLLANGVSVVLDATWRVAAHREALREVASELAAKVTEVRCTLAPSIAKERIARRMASIYNPSDATPELVDEFAADFEEWPQAISVATDQPVAESVKAACRAVVSGAKGDDQPPKAEREAPQPGRFNTEFDAVYLAVLLRGGLDPRPLREQ